MLQSPSLPASQAAAGADPVPVEYRYKICPLESLKTNVYRPTKLNEPENGEAYVVKHSTVGAVFLGRLNSLLKNNPRAAVLWEASLFAATKRQDFLTTANHCHAPDPEVDLQGCKLVPLKAKVYLTCELRLEAGMWYKL